MLERTSVVINDKEIEVRIEVGMPAAGRKILGKAAAHTLINGLPKIVSSHHVSKYRSTSTSTSSNLKIRPNVY